MPENDVKKILADLNPAQKQAVTYTGGPLLIIAGAGTGKTTVITRRIAWLILTGRVKPEEILAVTFTDKAAGEMEERVDKLLPYGYIDLWISTFHSFCERILQDHGLEIGLPLNFKLMDQVQQSFLIRENFKKFDLDYYRPLGNPTKFVQSLIKHFSRAKDELISPAEYLEYAENLKLSQDSSMSDELVSQEVARIREVANAYHTYQRLLLENNALDFGDLINYTIKLFEQRPKILEKYHRQFKYILVDEFQDTNWAQYKLLKMLASSKNNMTVVADDKQAIYRWRGAAYNNIFQLRKDYSKTKTFFLTKNYRSRQAILDLAYKFIGQNYIEDKISDTKLKDLLSKSLKTTRKGSAEIVHLHSQTQEEEARGVVKKIVKVKEKNPDASWNDFAVLVRANKQAEIFCQALRWNNVPYQFLARRGLFSKPIVLDILAYLKLLDDYHESRAVYRILTSPIFTEKITNDDLSNLVYWARRKNWSLYEAMKKAAVIPNLSSSGIQQLERMLNWIEKHTQLAKIESVSRVIYAFLEDSGYLNILSQKAEKDGRQNVENIFWLRQFFKKVENFEAVNLDKSMSNFVRMIDMMLETGDTGSIDIEAESGPEAVKVMTIHGAKGLEFRWVFVVNLVDRRFPTIKRREAIKLPQPLIKEIIPEGDIHLQEERRLLYVAMTRAKQGLFFTSAEDYGGKTAKKFSRFLYELGLVKKETPPEPALVAGFLQKPAVLQKVGKQISTVRLPTKFSFTQLAAFETCPLQYKFAFVLRIPCKGKYNFSFGRTMHNTLYQFLQQWLERMGRGQVNLFSQTGKLKKSKKSLNNKLTVKDLLKIYNEYWIDEWYENKRHQEKYKEKGKKILKIFYDDFIKASPQIKYLEKPFNFKLGEYVIKGKIDRIDEVDDGLEILDYKTGSSKNKLTPQNKQQLLIYQLAAQSLFSEPITQLTYYYLENGKKISFLGKPEELEQMEKKIKETIKEIKTSDFAPRPGQMCKWCDFRSICEYRQF